MKKYAAIFLLLFVSVVFGIEAGRQAQFFDLMGVNGKHVKLSDYKEKNLVIIFVATRCPYSNAFNNVMAQLAQDYSSKGVNFVGINSNNNESYAEVVKHAREHFSFPVLKDEGSKIADVYHAQVTPEAFVIDATGKVVYHGALGSSDNPTTDPAKANSDEIRAALDEMLAGKEVSKPKTKAFGCSIKRS